VPDIDLRSLREATRHNTIRSMLSDMAGELDLADGPVIKLALIKADDATGLLAWVGSRTVIDDGSWPRLIRDFHHAYSQLAATGAVEWDRPTGDFLDWADETAAQSRTVDAQLDDTPRPMHILDGELVSELTAEALHRATQHAHRAYRLEPHEVLLAALTRALSRVGDTGARATVVAERTQRPADATGHLLASAVGRFTELVTLPAATGAGDCHDTASAVKSGYRAPAGDLPPGPRFTVREGLRWTGSDPVSGTPWPDGPRSRPSQSLVEITPAMVDGTLRLRWWYAPQAEACVHAAAAELPRRLAELTAHFEVTSDSTVDASDFPLVDMTDEELQQFIVGLGDQ
jgi:Condensation domain